MNEINKNILKILQENSKTSYNDIAEKVGVAPSTIHFRVKKMITIKGNIAVKNAFS